MGVRTRVLLGVAIGSSLGMTAFGCGSPSSSSGPLDTHPSSSSSGGSGSGVDEGLDGGVRMIPGFMGVIPCSQAVDAGAGGAYGNCKLSMPVSGGLSGTINVPGVAVICGSSDESMMGIRKPVWRVSRATGCVAYGK